MIFEAFFWVALVAATRAIAKSYYRRRDVLYGPYITRDRLSDCITKPLAIQMYRTLLAGVRTLHFRVGSFASIPQCNREVWFTSRRARVDTAAIPPSGRPDRAASGLPGWQLKAVWQRNPNNGLRLCRMARDVPLPVRVLH